MKGRERAREETERVRKRDGSERKRDNNSDDTLLLTDKNLSKKRFVYKSVPGDIQTPIE